VWICVTELRRPKYFKELFHQVTSTLSDTQEVDLSIGIAVLQYNKESPSQLVITLGRAAHNNLDIKKEFTLNVRQVFKDQQCSFIHGC